jgi:ribosome-associated translation inhibitor RaiA
MHIEITTQGFELTPELDKYTRGKLAHIARRIPRALREEAVCSVQFKQAILKEDKINSCVIRLTAGGTVFEATETTLHTYAALDIVVAHVEGELKMYHATHSKWGAFARIRRTFRIL